MQIPRQFNVDPIKDIQILTAMRSKGVVCADNINAVLKKILNPHKTQLGCAQGFKHVYSVGDKVMQLKNDIDRNVCNGDIGHVVSVNLKRVGNSSDISALDGVFPPI
jgi:exodeoxyribonuclease V alpha subunit